MDDSLTADNSTPFFHTTDEGIQKFDKFLATFISGKYTQISIFKDGSFLTSIKKLYKKKVRKLGRPVLVIRPDIFEGVPNDRLFSIAEDINLDFIWIKKSFGDSLLY